MKKNNSNKPVRHGEVLLHPVATVPEGKVTEHKTFIVGHSETGHHHVLEAPKEYKVTKVGLDAVYVTLFDEGELVHKKTVNRHNNLLVAPGSYQVIRKNEYDPFAKIMREVWD
jgi:hypothetical protein